LAVVAALVARAVAGTALAEAPTTGAALPVALLANAAP